MFRIEIEVVQSGCPKLLSHARSPRVPILSKSFPSSSKFLACSSPKSKNPPSL